MLSVSAEPSSRGPLSLIDFKLDVLAPKGLANVEETSSSNLAFAVLETIALRTCSILLMVVAWRSGNPVRSRSKSFGSGSLRSLAGSRVSTLAMASQNSSAFANSAPALLYRSLADTVKIFLLDYSNAKFRYAETRRRSTGFLCFPIRVAHRVLSW
jgi:hypothetical protein